MGRELRDATAPAAPGSAGRWLVSPPFCCGVSWIANVLLELGVRTTYVEWRDRHWEDREGGSRVSRLALNHLQWHLAALEPDRVFAFEPGVEVLWGHELVQAREPAPTVLFVRDVRDAVHSLWLRDLAREMDLEAYLATRGDWPDHFPGCFGLTPSDTWALYAAFWTAVGTAMPVLTARFEDLRSDPVGGVERILRHWGLCRPRADIEAALESSSVGRLREAVERRAHATGWSWQTARRGRAGEWREWPDERSAALLSPIATDVMRDLGYEVPAAPGEDPDEEWLGLAAMAAREIASGRGAWVVPQLRATARSTGGGRAEALARCQLALGWVASIFPDGGPTAVVAAAARTFVTLVLRHPDWPPLVEATFEALERDGAPRPAAPPRRDAWSPPASSRAGAPATREETGPPASGAGRNVEEIPHVAS